MGSTDDEGVEHHLADKSEVVVDINERFVSLAARCGHFSLSVTKRAVAFPFAERAASAGREVGFDQESTGRAGNPPLLMGPQRSTAVRINTLPWSIMALAIFVPIGMVPADGTK